MADKTFVNLKKVGNYVRNKANPEAILCDKVKTQMSGKHVNIFLL